MGCETIRVGPLELHKITTNSHGDIYIWTEDGIQNERSVVLNSVGHAVWKIFHESGKVKDEASSKD